MSAGIDTLMAEQNLTIEQGEQGLDEAAKVRYLMADDIAVIESPNGSVCITIQNDRTLLRFSARRCFPLSGQEQYISLRDGAGEEIGIIRNLDELTGDQRRWIEEDLEKRYYTPLITEITRFRQRWGGVQWDVLTNRGSRQFVTKRIHDAFLEAAPGRLLLTDVDGNRYEIEMGRLDSRSRGIIERIL